MRLAKNAPLSSRADSFGNIKKQAYIDLPLLTAHLPVVLATNSTAKAKPLLPPLP
jgi:hypothetical protein